ncbi:MAG: hypothetical protein J6D18_02430, partial [Erysipelotrichaceae bacterium]|nr:hypothetical protein [Erysipelotrichaceae bacterium]
ETISLALMTSVGLMCLFMIGLEWAPDGILYLFSASRHMLSIGVPALRICCLSLPFAAVAIIRSTAMQALKHARFTLIINILRQFVLIVGSFLILSFLFKDVYWLWWAVPITEFCSFVIAGILHRKMDLDLHEDY